METASRRVVTGIDSAIEFLSRRVLRLCDADRSSLHYGRLSWWSLRESVLFPKSFSLAYTANVTSPGIVFLLALHYQDWKSLRPESLRQMSIVATAA
jgi:hypothetical protein